MRIFVEYENKEGGLRAFANLNGRFYDSKIMYVYFYNEMKFKQKDLGGDLHVLIDL